MNSLSIVFSAISVHIRNCPNRIHLNRNRRFNDPGVFCEAAFNTFFPIYE